MLCVKDNTWERWTINQCLCENMYCYWEHRCKVERRLNCKRRHQDPAKTLPVVSTEFVATKLWSRWRSSRSGSEWCRYFWWRQRNLTDPASSLQRRSFKSGQTKKTNPEGRRRHCPSPGPVRRSIKNGTRTVVSWLWTSPCRVGKLVQRLYLEVGALESLLPHSSVFVLHIWKLQILGIAQSNAPVLIMQLKLKLQFDWNLVFIRPLTGFACNWAKT